ncbi:hypothetical protein TcBrA4_0071110 [Trypanosoma cruzi]|nr:hypothetical protein TcBrA4_0071110 [Trypanosoma cruzi]
MNRPKSSAATARLTTTTQCFQNASLSGSHPTLWYRELRVAMEMSGKEAQSFTNKPMYATITSGSLTGLYRSRAETVARLPKSR